MLHLPVLRAGTPYRSLQTIELPHVKTGDPVARVSMANRGLIARDFLDAAQRRARLDEIPARELLAICKDAARHFVEDELPVDPVDGVGQTPDDYVKQLSATTGMPHPLCRANMEKIRYVLDEAETVLDGLTRGLDTRVLDDGWCLRDGSPVAYVGEAHSLGVILPSNSPGVHSLWLSAIPLKVPLVLKPGRQEPWTPLRIAQALIAAGCPPEAFCFYPTDYGGAAEILVRSSRAMLFGDESTVRPWRSDPRVQLHGPGWSKVIFGADAAPSWREHLDVVAQSIAENGGRSCLNASGVWLPSHGREMAEALAERLARTEALPLDNPRAPLAAFSNPTIAHRISEHIDRQLQIPGAVDLTAEQRSGPRLVEVDGCTFLQPTLVWCDDASHPLAASEFLFPFAAVVQVDESSILDRIGSTLVGTVISDDSRFRERAMAAPNIDRLNVGSFPTSRVTWDQPHEGNLFEHLYRRRALQYETA